MFTVVKCRGHKNFDLSKVYEGYFLTNLQFSTLEVIYLSTGRDLIAREREKSMV